MIGRALIAAALLTAAPAAAQDAMVKELAGSWQILPVDGRPGCTIQLTATRTGADRWKAVPATDCTANIPDTSNVVAWTLNDGTLLLDAEGKARMTFVEDETALSTSPDLMNPEYYLVSAIAGYSRIPQVKEWGGSWKIARKGGKPCTIILDVAPEQRVDASGCARGGAIAKLKTWSLEDLRLMLWGPNDQLMAFSPAGNARWTADGGWILSK